MGGFCRGNRSRTHQRQRGRQAHRCRGPWTPRSRLEAPLHQAFAVDLPRCWAPRQIGGPGGDDTRQHRHHTRRSLSTTSMTSRHSRFWSCPDGVWRDSSPLGASPLSRVLERRGARRSHPRVGVRRLPPSTCADTPGEMSDVPSNTTRFSGPADDSALSADDSALSAPPMTHRCPPADDSPLSARR